MYEQFFFALAGQQQGAESETDQIISRFFPNNELGAIWDPYDEETLFDPAFEQPAVLGQGVSYVFDKSPNSVSLIQDRTDRQPIWEAGPGSSRRLAFDGSNHRMVLDGSFAPGSNDYYLIYAVALNNTALNVVLSNTSTATIRVSCTTNNLTVRHSGVGSGEVSVFGVSSVSTGTVFIDEFIYEGGLGSAFRNGSASGDNGSALDAATQPYNSFGRQNNATGQLNAQVYFAMVARGAPSASDRAWLRDLISARLT